MAKSLRSKRERKLRAIKRIRYGAKELERLKKTLGTENTKKEIDEVMTDMSDVVIVTDSKTIQENANNETEKMDDDSVKHVYNKKTLRDQFGSYPVWMNQRRTRKQNNESKLKGGKKSNRSKSNKSKSNKSKSKQKKK